MTDYDFPNLTLHGRLVRDEESERAHANSPAHEQPTPQLEIGVEIDGHFLPLFSHRSSADVLAAVERTKAAAAESKSRSKSAGS